MIRVERFVNSFLASNTYLVYNDESKECLLVDCGDTKEVLSWIDNLALNPRAILLTHAHHDHIYGINDFINRYPDVFIYTNEFGKQSLLSAKLNLSKYLGRPFEVTDEKPIKVVDGKNCINSLLDLDIKLTFVPGHNPACIAYSIDGYFFTGDAYIPGVEPVTNVPFAGRDKALENYSLLEKLSNNMIVCPGHGDIIFCD